MSVFRVVGDETGYTSGNLGLASTKGAVPPLVETWQLVGTDIFEVLMSMSQGVFSAY